MNKTIMIAGMALALAMAAVSAQARPEGAGKPEGMGKGRGERGEAVMKARAEQIFAEADKDGNGVLSKDEFVQSFTDRPRGEGKGPGGMGNGPKGGEGEKPVSAQERRKHPQGKDGKKAE